MKKMKKLASIGLVLTMTVGLLAGCSGGGSNNGGSADASGGKGRYVEENWGNPFSSGEDDYTYIQSIAEMADGTLRAVVSDDSDRGFSLKDSKDGGKTWSDADTDLSALDKLQLTSSDDSEDGSGTYGYIGNVSLDSEGDIAFVYSLNKYSTEGKTSVNDTTETYYLLSKDGKLSEIKADIPGVNKTQHYEYDMSDDGDEAKAGEEKTEAETEDDGVVISDGSDSSDSDDNYSNGIQSFKLKDADNLYVSDYNGAVYHVTTGDGKIAASFDDFDWVNGMYLCGDKLLLDDYQKVIEYDTATDKKVAEHDELASIIQEKSNVMIADYLKDGNTIYYCCTDGIFTYNLDSNTSEQIVDGNMSSLISPNSSIDFIIPKADGQILLKFNDYTGDSNEVSLLNYAYDKDAAKRPDKQLTIYTLNDDYTIRTLAATYQKSHPDVYVNVVSGVSGDDAVTSSDAIRTLNTEVMAGEGPDVLFMDNLPVNSYLEKGLLADVSDVVNPMISDGKLFTKVAETYKSTDGKIYAAPLTFSMPIVIGYKDDLDQLNSLSDFVTLAEKTAEDGKKGQKFIETYGMLSLIGDMMSVNSASWFKEDGSLDTDSLKAYLKDIKAIYDASYDTLSDDDKADLEDSKQYYIGDDVDLNANFFAFDPSSDAVNVITGTRRIAYGNMAGSYGLQELGSIMRKDADLTYKTLPGSLKNVYVPSEVMAINAKSKNMDTAKDFFEFALSTDGQKALDNYNGFKVNKDSFDASMVDPQAGTEGYDPNASQGAWSTVDVNGNEVNIDMYWPTDDQIKQLKDMIDTLDTASYSDNTIQTTIIEDCIRCIISDDSIDDDVNQVVKDINIYLSE